MIIGGHDISIECPMTPQAVMDVLRVIQKKWPDGLLVLAMDSTPPVLDYFVYENESARQSWDEHGLTDSNGETMINVIFRPTGIDLVVNDEQGPTADIAAAIAGVLNER